MCKKTSWFTLILRRYHDAKLRNKMSILFSLFLTLPILFLGILSFYFLRRNMIEYERKMLIRNMNQLNNTVDFFFETYMDKSEMVYNNIEFQKILKKRNKTLIEKVEDAQKIVNILNPITSDIQLPEIKSSYYFGGNVRLEVYISDTEQPLGGVLRSEDEIKTESWYEELTATKTRFLWTHYPVLDGKHVIALSRKLLHFELGQYMGVLRIFIPAERVENILKSNNLGNNYCLYYMDENMKIIASWGKQLMDDLNLREMITDMDGEVNIKNIKLGLEEYLIGTEMSRITGYRLVYFVPISAISKNSIIISFITIMSLLGSIILCAFIAKILSSSVTRRVDILVSKTKQMTGGDFKVTKQIHENDELGQLETHFNQMAVRLDDLIKREYLSVIMLNRTKYELLQEQINPHLLYNTLSFLSYSAMNMGMMEFSALADNLTSFYKGILNRGKIITALKDEFDIIKAYIHTACVVYGLDIKVNFDIDQELLHCYSIKLILQPLVENAIIHGIKPNKCGILTIRCKQEGKTIVFTVEDDGVGMDDNKRDILTKINNGEIPDMCYGLGNVIRRIRLFFGNEYGVKIETEPWNGTSIRVTIPKLTRNEMETLMENINVNA